MDSIIFYVQDTPSLRNLSWSSQRENSFQQVISGEFSESGELAEIIELPQGDLTRFHPMLVFSQISPNVNTAFVWKGQSRFDSLDWHRLEDMLDIEDLRDIADYVQSEDEDDSGYREMVLFVKLID